MSCVSCIIREDKRHNVLQTPKEVDIMHGKVHFTRRTRRSLWTIASDLKRLRTGQSQPLRGRDRPNSLCQVLLLPALDSVSPCQCCNESVCSVRQQVYSGLKQILKF